MLGIIMGIASVVILQTIGEAAQNSITKQLSSLGSNNVNISSARAADSDPRALDASNNKTLLDDNMINLVKKLDTIKYISATQNKNISVKNGSINSSFSVIGIQPEYIPANSISLYNGTYFDTWDYENISYKAIIWAKAADTLFAKENPIWKKIQIESNYYIVIGVLVVGNTTNSNIYIPINTMKKTITNLPYYNSIVAITKETDQVESTKTNIEKLLQTAYISKWWAGAFSVSANSSILDSANQIVTFLKLFLGAVAGISLLIWWIGIMNIMLVSVSERTREIGIRKAVGAKYRDILLQFLTESAALTLISWWIWILLSRLVTLLLNKLNFMWQMSLSTFGLMIGVTFSIWVGILFGILPANKAANMKLVDALRFE